MATSNTNVNKKAYTTKMKGSIGNIITGTEIIVYNSLFVADKISIINLDTVTRLVKSSEYYALLTRGKLDENYNYDRLSVSNKLSSVGFDTIIYLCQGSPTGYTEFITPQGLLTETLRINVNFTVNTTLVDGSDSTLNIFSNDLSQIIEYGRSTKNLISDKLEGYTDLKKIRKEIDSREDVYSRFTNRISEINKHENDNIYLNNGFCNLSGLYNLDLIKEMIIPENFDYYQFGYYRGEIVLYSWNNLKDETIEYSIASLSRKDKFNNQIYYTNTSSKKSILRGDDKIKLEKILCAAGKFISVLVSSVENDGKTVKQRKVFDFVDQKWVNLDSENYLIDLWRVNSIIYEMPKTLSKSRVINLYPEILNVKLDIKNYNETIFLEKKIDDWFVLRQETSYGNFLIYTNLTKTIYLSEEKDKTIIPINNEILLLKDENSTILTYFVEPGTYYSEYAIKLKYNSNSSYRNNKDVTLREEIIDDIPRFIIEGKDIPEIYDNTNNYKNKNIIVDFIGDNLENSYSLGFKRNIVGDSFTVPNIIGSVSGLVYCKEGNTIRYF